MRTSVRDLAGVSPREFERSVDRGNVLQALALARQLHAEHGQLALHDALALCLLLADKDPPRYERAAARWHARNVLELEGVDLAESRLVLAALEALPTRGRAAAIAALRGLAERRRRQLLERVLARALEAAG